MLQFAVLGFGVFAKMSEMNVKQTLSQKLLKKHVVSQTCGKISATSSAAGLTDIEDVVIAPVKSEFFSPMQTRQQRKTLSKPIKIRELTNVKRVKKEETILTSPMKKTDFTAQNVTEPNDVREIKPKIAASTPALQKLHPKLEQPIWEPEHWRTMLANIREMRAQVPAPVDTMGCNKCSDADVDEKTQRFHILVALMLSSQTKDETTFEAVQRLRMRTLTPKSICALSTSELEDLLRPVSFYKTKAKHLQLTSRILIEQYDADIPRSVAELIKLPGVGPKMAHLCMSSAWHEITGIGVDVHVHRISNRMRWLPKQTKEPEQTRVALEAWLPRDLWLDVNHLLVGFGQTICAPVRPRCSDCLNRSICPSADSTATVAKTKKPKVKKEQKKIYL